MKVTFPYRITLSEKNCKLFTRCFMYCIESPSFTLDEEENEYLMRFCSKVADKEWGTRLIEQINAQTEDKPTLDPELERLFEEKMEKIRREDAERQRIRPPSDLKP